MRTSILVVLLSILSNIAIAQDVFFTKPYLQIGHNPSARSLDVLWHTTDVDAPWSVEFQISPASSWNKCESPVFRKVNVKGAESHRVYQTVFTGLTPGAKFNYRVLRDNKTVFSAEAEAPRSNDQPYRFVAFGDIGAMTADQKLLAKIAYDSKPDFVAVAGDIVYEYGLISDYRQKFWPVYNADKPDTSGAPIMRSIPFIAAVGNHDADSRDLDKAPDALAYYMYWDQPLNGPVTKEGGPLVPVLKGSDENKKAFLAAAGENYPVMSNFSFDYGNGHWTIIDSNPYVDWTDSSLVKWVADDLANAKQATWHFVLFHHPGFSSSREHFEQQQMRLLAPVFEKGKVDVVFSGHVHNYQRSVPMQFVPDKKGTLLVGGKDNKTIRGRIVNGRWTLDKLFDGKTNMKPKGIIYIVTGAGGQELYNPEQNNDPDSWQKFTNRFISNTHSLSVIDINGKTLTLRQVAADGRELDIIKVVK